MRRIAWRSVILAGLASVGLASSGCATGPFPHSKAWYEERANDPPGTRQVDSHGKLWPPFPRPVGQPQTALHKYHYAHYWPYPLTCDDRGYIEDVVNMQAASGWTSATTLRDYHFNPETQQLTEGGRDHLVWVAQSVPAQYRTVYIDQGLSRETDQLRIDAAEDFFREMNITDPPVVIARADDFQGRPAIEVEQIRRMEILAIPKPRLFYIGSATAGAAAGGGVPGGQGGPVGGAGATTTNSGNSR